MEFSSGYLLWQIEPTLSAIQWGFGKSAKNGTPASIIICSGLHHQPVQKQILAEGQQELYVQEAGDR